MSILVNDVPPREHYVATAGQTLFVIPFEWLEDVDLRVYVNGIPMTFEDPPANASRYKTTGVGLEGGGSLTFGAPGRLAGDEVIIFRDGPIESPVDFPAEGIFPVSALNDAFDRMTVGIQQTDLTVQQRSLRMDDIDFQETINPLPLKTARVDRMLGFDANGQPAMFDRVPGPIGPPGLPGAPGAMGSVYIGDTAPSSPVIGQLWWESDQGQMLIWYDDGTSQQWVSVTSVGASTVIIGVDPPLSPIVGQLWWESDTGQMFIWYQDINSAQWVPSTNSGPVPSSLLARIEELEARLSVLEGP